MPYNHLNGTVEEVDNLMRRLHQTSRGKFVQPLLAAYDVADAMRNHIQPKYDISTRPIVRLVNMSWNFFRLFGFGVGLRLAFMLWFLLGLPLLFRRCLSMHADSFTYDGKKGAKFILLRTGVSNEPKIAHWISKQHQGAPVAMLSINEKASLRLASLRYLPSMFRYYTYLASELMRSILQLGASGGLNKEQAQVLPPVWLMLLARRAPLMCRQRQWATRFLGNRDISHLYFTMNSQLEAAFMDALPDMNHAYVEHGFPRRDIPPLACRQYVYGPRYAAYLRSFDTDIEVTEIGTAYFPASEIDETTRTIVVASLQDWPQWGIDRVAVRFNAALAMAKEQGWHLVFRGRNYDEDAFAQGLTCAWDEVSTPKQESFAECLQRLKPTMVWTTWSTAVLDAEAMGIRGVCFIDQALLDYFIPDFGRRTLEIDETAATIESLEAELCAEATT